MSTTTTTTRLAGLAADTRGNPDDPRPPLLLLHGLTFDRTMWGPALTEFHRIDPTRRVVALDLPGHGGSVGGAPYSPWAARDAILAAVEAAGLVTPVVVGHSYSAILAVFYAASFPTSGIVSVDQTLQVGPFGALLRARADVLRGPHYLELWNELAAGLRIDLLSEDAQRLLRASCTPRQALLLGYWSPILDGDPAELDDELNDAIRAVNNARLPFTLVAGSEPGPDERAWMERTLPASTTIAWPGCGHFPQLARPEAFARILASTEGWPRMSSVPLPGSVRAPGEHAEGVRR